jgi:uncharacterized protein (DUF342 family)
MTKGQENKINCPLIGILAVKNQLITKEELETALLQLAGSKDPEQDLKAYFGIKELVSGQNIERLARAAKTLQIRQKEYRFGAIAIAKGVLNQSVLDLALEEQESSIRGGRKPQLIGDMLVDAGLLTEKQRDYILKLQNRMKKQNKKIESDRKAVVVKLSSQVKSKSKQKQKSKAASEPEPEPEPEPKPKPALKPKSEAEPNPEPTSEPTSEPKSDAEPKPGEEHSEDAEKKAKKEVALTESEIISGGIKLQVSGDFMSAFIFKTDHFNPDLSVMELKDILFEKDIIAGIVVDEMIEGFIKSSGFKTKSFRVAKGTKPIQGKDAKLEFFFNTDYLKAGGLDAEGNIDFKERGAIPHVEEDTVLAEKTPMVESQQGQNIYGEEVEALPSIDISLRFGTGAKLSEDEMKVLAVVRGYPKYSMGGVIYVHNEYTSAGDVDYETGHINYDGNVNIKGCIKAGFKVKGNDIKTIELDGGIVEAEGDVVVEGGINEGKIYARGNVYAKFIHNSEICCMGNVHVDKEIVESKIESSGSCVIESGKLISSEVVAKMGVSAKHIGTQMASPNVIKVGQDIFMEKELKKNKTGIIDLKEKLEELQEKKETLKEQNDELQKQITKLAHIQDRSQLQQREIEKKIADPENKNRLDELNEKVSRVKINGQNAEKNLDRCFEKSESIEESIETVDKELNFFGDKIDILLQEKNNLIQWARENPGNPIVTSPGEIKSGTIIHGKHSDISLEKTISHGKVREVLFTQEGSEHRQVYEMRIENF